MACPQKNDPKWKKLEAAYGPDEAMLAYIRNGEVIPDAEDYHNAMARLPVLPEDAVPEKLDKMLPKEDPSRPEIKTTEFKDGLVKRFFIALNNLRKDVAGLNLSTDWVKAKQMKAFIDMKYGYMKKRFNQAIEVALPKLEDRNALSAYIEAKGDMSVLRKWEEGSKPEFAGRYKLARELALDANFRKTADFTVNILKEFKEKGIAEGLLGETRDEGYVPHYYTKDEEKVPSTGGEFNAVLSRSKKRTYNNLYEAEQAGMKVATYDIGKIVPIYMDEFSDSYGARVLMRHLLDGKDSKGRPLASVIGREEAPQKIYQSGEKIPFLVNSDVINSDLSSHRPIKTKHWLFDEAKFLGRTKEGRVAVMRGKLGYSPEIVRELNNIVAPDAIAVFMHAKHEDSKFLYGLSRAMKAADVVSSVTKRLMLSLSTFHYVQEGLHAGNHFVNPITFKDPPIDLEHNPKHIFAAKRGLQVGVDFDAKRAMLDELGSSLSLKKIPGVGKKLDELANHLFHSYIPRIKMKTFEHILERNKRVYAAELAADPTYIDHVGSLSAEQTNAAFGHMNYTVMGRNKTLQHVLRWIFLAPDFLEARGRFVAQALKLPLGGKAGQEQASALAVNAISMYGTCRILNALINKGDTHQDTPFGVVYNNRVYSLRSVFGDIIDMMPKPGKDPLADPVKFFRGRINPILSGLYGVVTGKDYRGVDQTWQHALLSLISTPAPIITQGFFGSQRNKDIGAMGSFISAVGVQVKRYSPDQQIRDIAEHWMEKKGIPNDKKGSYHPSQFREVRNALQDGDIKKAKKEFQKLLDVVPYGTTPQQHKYQLALNFNKSMMKLFVNSAVNEQDFIKSLDPQQKQMYDDSKERRRQMQIAFNTLILPETSAAVASELFPVQEEVAPKKEEDNNADESATSTGLQQ